MANIARAAVDAMIFINVSAYVGMNWRRWRDKALLLRLKWKYRSIDPGLCCCGSMIGEGGDICHHGGCRSAVEYAIHYELEKRNKKL